MLSTIFWVGWNEFMERLQNYVPIKWWNTVEYRFNIENMEMQRVFAIDESICDLIFIGYHRNPNNTWVWDNGDLSKYSNWIYGYPTSQNCALMQLDGKDAGLWTDEDCSHLECYMCQIVL